MRNQRAAGIEIRRFVVAEREPGLGAGQRNILVVLQRLKLKAESDVVLALRPQNVVLQIERRLRFVERMRVGAVPTYGRVVAGET